MSRYIDADELKKVFSDGYEAFAETLREIVDEQPTADVVPSKYGCGSAPYCSWVFEVDEDE